jgi:hypothetical protein
LLILLILAAIALFVWWRYRRRPPVAKTILARDLDEIRLDYRQGQADTQAALNAVARLLRRALIAYHGRRETAASTGEAWLEQLAQLVPGAVFSDRQLQWLAHERYRRAGDCEVEALLEACDQWIRHLPREERRHAAD